MDLLKSGKLLCDLRKSKGMTQKQVADILGVLPKTVSKWETGRGFPDVSMLSALADILGVSEKTILSGDLKQNLEEAGNMKRTKFYVCPDCGSFMQGVGNCSVICCGKQTEALKINNPDDEHIIKALEIEDNVISLTGELGKTYTGGTLIEVTTGNVINFTGTIPSIEGLATEGFVAEAIADIELPETDLIVPLNPSMSTGSA